MALPSFHETFGNLFEVIQRGRNDGHSGSESDSLYQRIHTLDDYLDLPSGDSDIPLLPLTPLESDTLSVTPESLIRFEKNLKDWQDFSEKDEEHIPQKDECGNLEKFSENMVSQINNLSVSSSPLQFYHPNLVNCSSPPHCLNTAENEKKDHTCGKQKCESEKVRCNSQSQGIDNDKSAISPSSTGDMEPKLKEIFKIKSKLEQNNNIWEKCRGCDSNDIFEDVETVMDILGIEKVNNSPEKAITIFSKDAVPIDEKTDIYKSTKVKRENSVLFLPQGISKIDNTEGISDKHSDSICNSDISPCLQATGTSCQPCENIPIKSEEKSKFILKSCRNPSVDACSLPNLSSPTLKSYNRTEKENETISDCENDIDCLENLPIDELLDICKMENSESYLCWTKQESEVLSKSSVETGNIHQLDYKDYSSCTLHNSAPPLKQMSSAKDNAADNDGDSSQQFLDSGSEQPLDVAAPDSTTDLLGGVSAANLPAKPIVESYESESQPKSAASVNPTEGSGYVDLNKVTSTDENQEISSNPGGKISEDKISIISEKETKPIFKCEECGKFYSNSKSLSKHKVIHSPFRCDNCGRRFKLEETWQKHVTILTCKTKVRRVPKVANLDKSCLESTKKQETKLLSKKNENLVLETSVEDPFHCVTCGKTYKTKRSLNRHTTRSIGCRKVASEGDRRQASPKSNSDNNVCNLVNLNELSSSREHSVTNSSDAVHDLEESSSQRFAESGRTTNIASNVEDKLLSLASKVSSVSEINEGKPSSKCGEKSGPDFINTDGCKVVSMEDVNHINGVAYNSNASEIGGITDSLENLKSDIVGKNANNFSSKFSNLESDIRGGMSFTESISHAEFESPKMGSGKTIGSRDFECKSEVSESVKMKNSVGGSLPSLFPNMGSVINKQESNTKYCGDSKSSSAILDGANIGDSIDVNDRCKEFSKESAEHACAPNPKTCIKNCNEMFDVKVGDESLKVFDGCEKITKLEDRESCNQRTSSRASNGIESSGSSEFYGQSNRGNEYNKLFKSESELVDSSGGSCVENLEERSAITCTTSTHRPKIVSGQISSKFVDKSNCEGSFTFERSFPRKEGIPNLSQDPKILSVGLVSQSNKCEKSGREFSTEKSDGSSLLNVQKEPLSGESSNAQVNAETPVNVDKLNAKNRCRGIGYSILIPSAGSQKHAENKNSAKSHQDFTSTCPDNSRPDSMLGNPLANKSVVNFESISNVSDNGGVNDFIDSPRLSLDVGAKNFPPEISGLTSETNKEKLREKSLDDFDINSKKMDEKYQPRNTDDLNSLQELCQNESSSEVILRNVPYPQNVTVRGNEGLINNFISKNSASIENPCVIEETKTPKQFIMLENVKPRFPLDESEIESYSTFKILELGSAECMDEASSEYLPSTINNCNVRPVSSSSLEILHRQSRLIPNSLLPEQIKLSEERHSPLEEISKDEKCRPSKGSSKMSRSVLSSNQKTHPIGAFQSKGIPNNFKPENVASKRKRSRNSSPKRKRRLLSRENEREVVKENGEAELNNMSYKNICPSIGDSIPIPDPESRKLGTPAKGKKRAKCPLPLAKSRPKTMTKNSLTSSSLEKFEPSASDNLALSNSLNSSTRDFVVEGKSNLPDISHLKPVEMEEKLSPKSFVVSSDNSAGNEDKTQRNRVDINLNGGQMLGGSDSLGGVELMHVPCSENEMRKRRRNSSPKGKSSVLSRENQRVEQRNDEIFADIETGNDHRTQTPTKKRKVCSNDRDDPCGNKPTDSIPKKKPKKLNSSKGLNLKSSPQKRCKTATKTKKEGSTKKVDNLNESWERVGRHPSENSSAKLNDVISTRVAKKCEDVATSEGSHLLTDNMEVRIYLERCEQKLNTKFLDKCYPFEGDAMKPKFGDNGVGSLSGGNRSLLAKEKGEGCKKQISAFSDSNSSDKKKNQSTCKNSKAKSASVCEVSNSEDMLWPCDKCEKSYKHKQSLLRHKNQCHAF